MHYIRSTVILLISSFNFHNELDCGVLCTGNVLNPEKRLVPRSGRDVFQVVTMAVPLKNWMLHYSELQKCLVEFDVVDG